MHSRWRPAALVLAACTLTPGAVAHARRPATGAQALPLAYETAVLGRGHALAHLAARRAASGAALRAQDPPQPGPPGPGPSPSGYHGNPCGPRRPAVVIDTSSPPPAADEPTGQNRCLPLPPQPTTPAALARFGRWEQGSVDLPHYAIHAALLPTGKVLFWGFEWTRSLVTKLDAQVGGRAAIWDPAKGTGPASVRLVPPPLIDVNGDGRPEPTPIYCSGQSFLPDGRLLVAGGTFETAYVRAGYPYPPGHRLTLVFDPFSETWASAPKMSTGRWYPTLTELADGRTLILGGFNNARPNDLSSNLDVVSPTASTITHVARADRRVMLYPGMSLMPSGMVLLAGPFRRDSALLDPATMRWRRLPALPTYRGGANTVPLPTRTGRSPRVELIGGTTANGYFDRRSRARAFRGTLVLDTDARRPRWRAGAPLNRARHYPNTVLLPDGSMVTVGGSSGITPTEGNYTPDPANRQVELWDPATGRWTLGPAQREDRTYHSVALLLPDGRVWSAGDDANPNRDGDTAELYAPPYLFRGARPRITSAPGRVRPGRPFTVRVAGRVRRMTLLAPSAVTHGVDMHQRFVELRVRRSSRGRLTVDGPRDTRVAPPGRWMLFAIGARGVPSVARWVVVR